MRSLIVAAALGALTGSAHADVPTTAKAADSPHLSIDDCTSTNGCGIDWSTKIAGVRVQAYHSDTGSDAVQVVEIAGHYFDVGHIELAVGNMSDELYRGRRDRMTIESGTFEDGTAAAVVRLDWSDQNYHYVWSKNGVQTTRSSPWQKHVDVVVCRVDAPACSDPQELRCSAKGCRVTFRGGKLTVR